MIPFSVSLTYHKPAGNIKYKLASYKNRWIINYLLCTKKKERPVLQYQMAYVAAN